MKFIRLNAARLTILLLSGVIGACGGGGGGEASGPVSPPPATTLIDVVLSAGDVVAGSSETGTATAEVRYTPSEASVSITVTLNGLTAESVSLRRGFAGDVGMEIQQLVAGSTADTWELERTSLNSAEASDLDAGAWHLLVSTATAPDGALRGQILSSGVAVGRFSLTADQVTTGSQSTASAKAWLTLDSNRSEVASHIVTSGIDDATAVELRTAKAGLEGPVAVTLTQNAASVESWSAESVGYTAALRTAVDDGDLYGLVTNTANPDGAIRGQYIPEGIELITTDLVADAVVMSSATARSSLATGRAMTTLGNDLLTTHVNLFGIPDTIGVELRQAPAGQNGPVLAGFARDSVSPTLWSLRDHPLDSRTRTGLDNQTLYLSVVTALQPNGAARGQIAAADSAPAPDSSTFHVVAVDPMNAARLEAMPSTYFISLNREPLPASVTPGAIAAAASGGDGSFGDGNEVAITPSNVAASGNTIEVSFAGVSAADDVYRVRVRGGGSDGVVDTTGIALDGDGDGNAGGTFESAFEVARRPVGGAFGKIQDEIFTVSCASSDCHSGAGAPDGLDLTAGQAYENIVNVRSVQMPDLFRIEPGDPDNSYLVRKVEGRGIAANRMPLGGPPLSSEQIDLIRAWVSDGAPDD